MTLKFPKKSHRKEIKKPDKSTKLAELMGVIFGDGGMTRLQLVISLNSILDSKYSNCLKKLLKELFGIKVKKSKRPNQNTLTLVCSGMNLVDFLIKHGVVVGNKIRQKIDIPSWIKGNLEYEKAFVRGLVDTDGCLYIHKHWTKNLFYNNIGFCFTNKSKNITKAVAKILKKSNIKPYITKDGIRVYLYGSKEIVKYLNTFKPSNERITNKYKEWLKLKK